VNWVDTLNKEITHTLRGTPALIWQVDMKQQMRQHWTVGLAVADGSQASVPSTARMRHSALVCQS
jgi:hypothetical protein